MSPINIMMMITAFIVAAMVARYAFFRLLVWYKPSKALKLTYIDGDGLTQTKIVSFKSDAPALVETILEMRTKAQQHKEHV
jgi:hypothetical protein